MISVDTPSDGSRSGSDTSNVADDVIQPPRCATKPVSMTDLFGESDSDSDGAISVTSEIRRSRNSLLSPEDFSCLPPTVEPRINWIPGYRSRVPKLSREVSPWSSRRVSWTSVAELDVKFFLRHLSKPRDFIFPTQDGPIRAPSDSDWSLDLITFTQISNLYKQEPWKILGKSVDPVSFIPQGWFGDLLRIYRDFETRDLQAIWESTHRFPISNDQRQSDPRLDDFYRKRQQRRSHAGPRWKNVISFILQGMIGGLCDLDILLDPVFLHLPQRHDHRMWYPGLDNQSANPPDLTTAMTTTDAAEPWRIQFRSTIQNHPGSNIIRLRKKFESA